MVLRGKPRGAQQGEEGAGVQRAGGHVQTGLARPRRHVRRVDAAPVVADVDRHQIAGGGGAERDGAFRALAERDPLVRRLDAVADGVANQMQHRIHHPFDQVLVDFGRLAPQQQRDLLAGLPREIANDERHPAEDLADRHQPHPHQPFAQRPQLAVDGQRVLLDGAPLDRGHVRLDARQRVEQAGAADDQVADVAHQLIQAGQIDAHDVRRHHLDGGAAAIRVLGGWRSGRRRESIRRSGLETLDGDRFVLERGFHVDSCRGLDR